VLDSIGNSLSQKNKNNKKPNTTKTNKTNPQNVLKQCNEDCSSCTTHKSVNSRGSPYKPSFTHGLGKSAEKRQSGKDTLSSSPNTLNAHTRMLAAAANDPARFELFCLSFREQLQDHGCSALPAPACRSAGRDTFLFGGKFYSKQAFDC